jgi:hypothetical protein
MVSFSFVVVFCLFFLTLCNQHEIITHAVFPCQLANLGPSATNETALQILWPSHDRRGNPILELEGKLELSGAGTCTVQLITPENATVSWPLLIEKNKVVFSDL